MAGFETAKQLIRSARISWGQITRQPAGKSTGDFIYKVEIVLEEVVMLVGGLKEAKLSVATELDLLIKRSK